MSRISENEQAKTNVTKRLFILLSLAIALPLSGCGQKGPLTMPEEPKQNETAERKSTT